MWHFWDMACASSYIAHYAAEQRVFNDKGYGITEQEYLEIRRKQKSGTELTEEEQQKLDTFDSEYGATITEYALGSEYAINKIVMENESLAVRILDKISSIKRSLLGKSDGYSRAERRRINEALKLYYKAAEAAGNKALMQRIRAMREEDDEDVTLTRGSKEAENAENEAANNQKSENMGVSDTKYSLIGVADDGKKIYSSNFPKGTPKAAKSERILNYIKNVWSKKPIRLVISNGNNSRVIFAKFDPTVDASQNVPTDASKLAGGNRHGNHTEQRVTLDLADDYYEIASESKYNYSKLEIGKDSSPHKDVKMWHYFVNDIYFAEFGEERYTPYTVTINIKEKIDGDFVYSFNAEKEPSTRQTLHAAVNTKKGANGELFIDSIPDSSEKVNSKTKYSYKSPSEGSVHNQIAENEAANNQNSENMGVSEVDSEGEIRYNRKTNSSLEGEPYGREEGIRTGKRTSGMDRDFGGRGTVSVSDDHGGVRPLSEIITNRQAQRQISTFGEIIYQNTKTVTQDILKWHAENENISLYFVKWTDSDKNRYIYENNHLFIPENASEKKLVDILNEVKPIKRNIDQSKIAHISEERKNKFLRVYQDAYITRIPIQQFLNMTTESYVDQRQINSLSSKISESSPVESIKNTSGEYMYLKIDLKSGEVIEHEGRHRMTALLNAGNAYADVFVILVNGTGQDSYRNLRIKGQYNNNAYSLNLIRANSEKFAKAIDSTFWREDGNIRYSRKASGNTVTMSKGQAQKRRANYESDRVFSKSDVAHALNSVKGFENVPAKARGELIDEIWSGLNGQYSPDNRKSYLEIMANKVFWTALQESGSTFDNATQEEIYAFEREIHKVLQKVGEERGKLSIRAKMEAEFDVSQAGYWKKQRDLALERVKLEGQLMEAVKKTRENKVGMFLGAHQYKSDDLRSTVEQLTRINFRGNLNVSGTRKLIKKLSEWYVKDNPMLRPEAGDKAEFTYNRFDENIAFLLSKIGNGEGGLTNGDLSDLLTVVTYFNGFVEGFNRVNKNGKYIDAIPHAKKHVEVIKKHQYVRVGWVDKLFKSRFAQAFFRPKTLATRMDMGSDGFYNETLDEIRQGLIAAAEYEREMMAEVEKFAKENKRYFKELGKRELTFDGEKMPVNVAMSLYMTTNREQAKAGLALAGIRYKGERVIDIEGKSENSSDEAIEAEVKRIRDEIYSKLSDTDKAFIKVAEKIFNGKCKELKRIADIELHYYSNVFDGYYFPIYRAVVSKKVDTEFENLIIAAENQHFNKSTEENAKNALRIKPLTDVLGQHVRGVAQYAGLSMAIRNYDISYNIDVSEGSRMPVTIASESEKVWGEGNAYFKKMLADILGKSERESAFLSALRGSYATYQLGANLKTLATQLSSIFAATSEISYGSIAKGMAMSGKDVDKYSPLAKLRNANNDAILAQVNTDRPGLFDKQNKAVETARKVGEVLMTPIGWVDRFVVERLFPACQVEIESRGGPKVGTEENKIQAGKLLERVIFNTQQNALATEKSAAMRSSNTVMKTMQMFGSDAMNVLGQWIDSRVEVAMLNAMKKKTTDKAELEDIERRLKAARKKAAAAVGSLATSSVWMVVLACLFNAFYHRIKDEDEDGTVWDEIGQDALTGFIGNMVGGIPILRDVFDHLSNGYSMDSYVYSMFNDVVEAVSEVNKFVESAFTDQFDGRQAARTARNVIYSLGQLVGIPMRNMYNLTYGILGFIPSVKYGIDSIFYEPAYSSDLKRAIAAGDEDTLAIIVEAMTGERTGAIKSNKAREELNDLTLKGYSVLPRAVADSIKVGEEEITLTNTQKKQFKKIYAIANEGVEDLVKLKQYNKASDEVRAKAIKLIYDIYYELAVGDVTGSGADNKNVLFAEAIDIEKLALIVAEARTITADKDRNGNAISGTKKAKVERYVESLRLTAAQKYMIMGYLGYTNKNGKTQVQSYISRLKLTKDEKNKLLEFSGYK